MTNTNKYVQSVCNVIEHLTRAELTKQGYKLVVNYLQETADMAFSDCARYAIYKYVSKEIPTLEEIRARHRSGSRIDELDDLILRMEFEAKQLEKHRD